MPNYGREERVRGSGFYCLDEGVHLLCRSKVFISIKFSKHCHW